MAVFSSELSKFYAGFGLAVLSACLIGSGFVVKKTALLRVATSRARAGYGGLSYLREWRWWLGLALFGVGEGANFIAYMLAPASLVTPLGALSVLVCAILSSNFLNERLSFIGKLGCLICMLGSTLIVLHAPKEPMINSLMEMQLKFFDYAFLIYGAFVLAFTGLLIFAIGPRLGNTNPVIFLLISGNLGSISVMACKGLGLAFQDMSTFGYKAVLTYWFFWLLLGLLLSGLVIQLYYLNRALDLFNTGLVTALLYVFFTGFVLIASSILFREWAELGTKDFFELSCGLILVTIGVFMMTVLKDLNLELRSIPLRSPNSLASALTRSCHISCPRDNQSNSRKRSTSESSPLFPPDAESAEKEPLNSSTTQLIESV